MFCKFSVVVPFKTCWNAVMQSHLRTVGLHGLNMYVFSNSFGRVCITKFLGFMVHRHASVCFFYFQNVNNLCTNATSFTDIEVL